MKRLTILFITLSIAAFVWIGLSGINFIQDTSVEEEGFATNTSPITRASDCNCLPGYIPSNDTSGYNGKIFSTIWYGTEYLFNPDGTKDVYWIRPDNSCGIPNINLPSQANSGNYTFLHLDNVFGATRKYIYKGSLQCNMIKKSEAASGIFFCQNLNNPEKRRNCY